MKKWVLRIAFTWLVIVPLALLIMEPKLLNYATEKAQSEAYAQCQQQAAAMPQQFPPQQPKIAEDYCNCVKTGVFIDRELLIARALKKEMDPAFQERITKQVATCNYLLQPR